MTDPNFHISTPRLYLSYFLPTSDAHVDFIFELFNSPSFIAAVGDTGMTTRDLARGRIQAFVNTHEKIGYGQYLISLKPDNSSSFYLSNATPIGAVSLLLREGFYSVPDIGFAITPSEHGKGYASEAATALMEYARKEHGVTQFTGYTRPGNIGSRKTMEKCGLKFWGEMKLRRFEGRVDAVYCSDGMGKGPDGMKEYGYTEKEMVFEKEEES